MPRTVAVDKFLGACTESSVLPVCTSHSACVTVLKFDKSSFHHWFYKCSISSCQRSWTSSLDPCLCPLCCAWWRLQLHLSWGRWEASSWRGWGPAELRVSLLLLLEWYWGWSWSRSSFPTSDRHKTLLYVRQRHSKQTRYFFTNLYMVSFYFINVILAYIQYISHLILGLEQVLFSIP